MSSANATDALQSAGDLLQQTVTGFARLIEQSTQLGVDLLNSFSSAASSSGLSSALPPLDLSSIKIQMPSMQSCGCKIPPPCWIPRQAGRVVSHVCPGSTATLRICVTNCGTVQRTITFDDGGKKTITLQPAALTLGPLETGCITATLTASGECEGEQSAIVWIRGCKEQYIRWTVKAVKRGANCACHEISVDDCPDYIHHWYDHFYCTRPCTSHRRQA